MFAVARTREVRYVPYLLLCFVQVGLEYLLVPLHSLQFIIQSSKLHMENSTGKMNVGGSVRLVKQQHCTSNYYEAATAVAYRSIMQASRVLNDGDRALELIQHQIT